MEETTEPAGGERFAPEIFDAVLSAAQAGAGWAATRLYQALAGRVAGHLRTQGVTDFEDARCVPRGLRPPPHVLRP